MTRAARLVCAVVLLATYANANCASHPMDDQCKCYADASCGFCVRVVDGATGGCQAGNQTGPPTVNNTCPPLNGEAQYWVYGNGTSYDACKSAMRNAQIMQAISGGSSGFVGFVVFVYFCIWWLLRGRYWWVSTSHQRYCCAPDAICNGCCFCRPYDAQEPKHYPPCIPCSQQPKEYHDGEQLGSKYEAYRVAPGFPQNPCAECSNEPRDEKHPCGCGYACSCNWVPGCCCFHWPRPCVMKYCEDKLEPPQTLMEQAMGMAQKKGGKCCFCCGGGKNQVAPQPPPNQQQPRGGDPYQQGQGHPPANQVQAAPNQQPSPAARPPPEKEQKPQDQLKQGGKMIASGLSGIAGGKKGKKK